MPAFAGEVYPPAMELVRGKHNLPEAGGIRTVVTVGNFDGVHLGHQALIARTRALASVLKAVPTAVIFEPHPREFLDPGSAPPRVQTFRGKLCQLQRAGIARVACLRFDRRQAQQSAEAFAREVLLRGLNARAVVVGEDFRFGAGRCGDLHLLRELAAAQGVRVEGVPAVTIDGQRASSTALRAALAAPDLGRVHRLLGGAYRLIGRVRHGLKLGRELQMPTANIPLRRPLALAHGVYAVRVGWAQQPVAAAGVASLGRRPTLGLNDCVLEIHLFDPPGDLYGLTLEVEFLHYLRAQRRFDDLNALRSQMHADAARARALLGD